VVTKDSFSTLALELKRDLEVDMSEYKDKIGDLERYVDRGLPVDLHLEIVKHINQLLSTNASAKEYLLFDQCQI